MAKGQGDTVAGLRMRFGQRRWRLDPSWQALFEIHRASEFRRLVQLWWLILPLLHAFLAGLGVLALWRYPMGRDEWLYLETSIAGAAIIGASILLVKSPAGLMSRDQWLPWSAFLLLSTIAYGVVRYKGTNFAHYAFMLCPMVVMIYMWGLRPSFRAAAKFALLNLMASPLIWFASDHVLSGQYVVQMGLVCSVGLFCVFMREEQDRDAFLKAVHLHEAELALKVINQSLDEMAHIDPLTSLPNRRSLNDFLTQECHRAARNRSPLSVLMIDVDYFKRFNDSHGHLEGDACLISVAHALRSALQRPGDSIARFGGEEFVVVLPETDLHGARKVAIRLLRHVDELGLAHESSDVATHVTVSVGGISMTPRRSVSALEVLQMADDVLYQVKARGRHAADVRTID